MFCLKYFSFSRRAFQHPLNSVCILVVFEIFVFFFFIQKSISQHESDFSHYRTGDL